MTSIEMPVIIKNLHEFKTFIESKGFTQNDIWFAIDISLGSHKAGVAFDNSIIREFNQLFNMPLTMTNEQKDITYLRFKVKYLELMLEKSKDKTPRKVYDDSDNCHLEAIEYIRALYPEVKFQNEKSGEISVL